RTSARTRRSRSRCRSKASACSTARRRPRSTSTRPRCSQRSATPERRSPRSWRPDRVARVGGPRELLELTASLAADFLDSLDERPVFPRVSLEELRDALGTPLPEEPLEPARVVEELAQAADPGVVAIPSGRYF